VRNIESTAIATKNEEMAALAKKNYSTNETILALAQQLVAASQTQAAPSREQAVGAAVTSIATGAAAGDTRLQQALDLLKARHIEDARSEERARSLCARPGSRPRRYRSLFWDGWPKMEKG
jgi:uncharacterized protein YigA (DUF484 family)